VRWVYYRPERLASARANGKIVLLDFTAEWCLNCKMLERTVLRDPEVATALNRPEVVPMKVDLTGGDPKANALLKRMDRVAIPLLVVLAPGRERPVLKAEAYTPEQVLQALARARDGT
jgi:thiol:disulfide interchange protein DsbD